MFRKENKGHRVYLFLTLSLGWLSLGWIDPFADKIREGNSLYQHNKYDEALDKYINAQVNSSGTPSKKETRIPQLDFNIADTQYKRGKYPEAAQLFEKLLQSHDNEMKAKSSFNLGNTMYRQGKMKEALEYYKKTVDFLDTAGPNNHELNALKNDAKYNYEYVEKKMKEQQQQQEQKEQQQEQKQEEQKEDDKQSEENEGKEDEKKQESQEDNPKPPKQENIQKKDENKKDKHPHQPEKDEQKDRPLEQQQPQPQGQKQMSKEEAERLLDALNQSEKEARTMKREAQQLQHRPVEKDW